MILTNSYFLPDVCATASAVTPASLKRELRDSTQAFAASAFCSIVTVVPIQSSPTIIGLSPSRPVDGAPPIRMIFSRSLPNPSISVSGRGGQPGT